MKQATKLFFFTTFSFLFLFSCQKNNKKEIIETAELEETEIEKPAPVIEYGFNLDEYELEHDTIRSGDSFGKIMNEKGFSSAQVHRVNESTKEQFNLARLNAGRPYTWVKHKKHQDSITAFIYHKNKIEYAVLHLEDSIHVDMKEHPVTTKRRAVSGYINSSLYLAMEEIGATPALIQELSSLYQWKIDFFRIQKGDKFKLIYYENYIQDSVYVGVKNIEAAEFTHYGEPFYAFRFGKEEKTGFDKYYDDEANSLQNFFLRAPVEYTRISSRYSPRRFHPVQKRWKSHLGTDYAAPTGTPIQTSADGIIVASTYSQYNGNYVKVQHNSKYTTQYLHMSRRNVRVGQRVKQGDIIGFVGQTGLATGPHVCYRFWVNGKQEDPYRQKMPSSEPLADSLKPNFFQKIEPLKKELDNIIVEEPPKKTNLASFP